MNDEIGLYPAHWMRTPPASEDTRSLSGESTSHRAADGASCAEDYGGIDGCISPVGELNRHIPAISIRPAVTLIRRVGRVSFSNLPAQEDSHRCREKHNLQKRSSQQVRHWPSRNRETPAGSMNICREDYDQQ
jgi:hypothetical protein